MEDKECFQSTGVCLLNSFQSKKMQRECRTILVTLFIIFLWYTVVQQANPISSQSANIPIMEQMNNLTVNVYSWDEQTGLCLVQVSESSPVGNQCLDCHLDLFPIRNEHLTFSKIITSTDLIKHITKLEAGSKL